MRKPKYSPAQVSSFWNSKFVGNCGKPLLVTFLTYAGLVIVKGTDFAIGLDPNLCPDPAWGAWHSLMGLLITLSGFVLVKGTSRSTGLDMAALRQTATAAAVAELVVMPRSFINFGISSGLRRSLTNKLVLIRLPCSRLFARAATTVATTIVKSRVDGDSVTALLATKIYKISNQSKIIKSFPLWLYWVTSAFQQTPIGE
ncbi:hypothetical protein H5410_008565 [Solanum commersonii]|uniref:Uncharacterized protein n=1 Tax=Solanum commersonii TaxID=4109 RepID=A0A9J6AG56_SOLCO|nr:hypothetical protein H5410_008565 [Solanum commersonii]